MKTFISEVFDQSDQLENIHAKKKQNDIIIFSA